MAKKRKERKYFDEPKVLPKDAKPKASKVGDKP